MNSRNLLNPFTAKTPVRGKCFFGREKILERIFDYVNAVESVSLVGERRTGKTSVLQQILELKSERLQDAARHILVYMSFDALQGYDEETIWKAVLDTLLEQSSDIDIDKGGLQSDIQHLGSNRLLFQVLLRLFRRLAQQRVRVTFLFDEFESTITGEKPVDIRFFKLLRNIALDRGTSVNYVIATRQELSRVEKALELRFTSLSSPLFNIFHQLVLSPFSEEEARLMVDGLLQTAGLESETRFKFWQQRDLLFRLSGFHPFFLQIACYHLFSRCLLADGTFDSYVPQEEIKTAFQSETSEHFHYYWEISSPVEQEVLVQLATDPDRLDTAVHQHTLNTLRTRCLAAKADTGWQLFSESLALWIQQRHTKKQIEQELRPTDYFVGRKDELEAFRTCLASQDINGIYFYGPGGIGKSMLLRKIGEFVGETLQSRTVFLDFFSTKNRSIEGFQTSIIEEFPGSRAFEQMWKTRQRIEDVRLGSSFSYRAEFLSSLQKQAQAMFVNCCNELAKDQQLVFVFDSFEYVQHRDVGRWFAKEFLPHLKRDGQHGIVVALAGRPDPRPASMPANITSFQLKGLSKDEVREYVQRLGFPYDQVLDQLFEGTRGNPLLLELLRWRGRRELLMETEHLRDLANNPETMAAEIFDVISETTPVNRILWAMALFRRRFDIKMLEYLIDNMLWLRNADYDVILSTLRQLPFVKTDEAASSHMLHDAVVQPIALVFKRANENKDGKLERELWQSIVHRYYPEQIARSSDQNERMYLQTEYFGYILDRDIDDGIAKYSAYLDDIKKRRSYDFEGLLWDELGDRIKAHGQRYLDVMLRRAQWLSENGLYRELELLGRDIVEMPTANSEQRISGSHYLGIALLRQGKLHEADKQFRESLDMARQLGSESYMADTENYLGQVAEHAGKYDEAATHYWRSIQTYTNFEEPQKLARAYSARGLSLAMVGDFERARMHCDYALKILEKYQDALPLGYALKNIGIVYRLAGDYDAARTFLIKGGRLAESGRYVELEIDILRERASADYWSGRKAREVNQDLESDCDDQENAFELLVIGLEKARTISHRIQIARSMLQLAYVFEEISRIESTRIENIEFPSAVFDELILDVHALGLVEDVYWLRRGLVHFPETSFADLALWQKTIRLFEIGAQEANEANQHHVSLESQMEIARILVEMRCWDEVKSRLECIKNSRSEVYEDRTLAALTTLLQADVAFDQGDFTGALTRYAQAFPIAVTSPRISAELVGTRIQELLKRIKAIEDVAVSLKWCRTLQGTWSDAQLDRSYPSIFEQIEILYHELLEKQRMMRASME